MMTEEKSVEKSIWTEYISARAARNVARALKVAGYGTATRKNCRGYVIDLARYFEPGDVEQQQLLLRLICEAAGSQPKKEEN